MVIRLLVVDIESNSRDAVERVLEASGKRKDKDYVSFSEPGDALTYLRTTRVLPLVEVVTLPAPNDVRFSSCLDIYRDYDCRRWHEKSFAFVFQTEEARQRARRITDESGIAEYLDPSDSRAIFRYMGIDITDFARP